MAITSMEAEKIVSETLGWFRARVAQHYVDLESFEMSVLEDELMLVLSAHTTDQAILNKQYNPKTDEVEEI